MKFAINNLIGYISNYFFYGFSDIFEKNYSIKYVKKDSKKDLSMLPVDPIFINASMTPMPTF